MKIKTFVFWTLSVVPALLSAQNEATSIQEKDYSELERCFIEKQAAKKYTEDWAKFNRYEEANAALNGKKVDAVFMGNSITDGWAKMRPEFFEKNNYVGRGISGQTSSEMLVRFRADVIDLHPKVVVILAGTNDIAGNNGLITMEHTMQNIQSMCELAKANKIVPILCSVTPSRGFSWRGKFDPGKNIAKLNNLIREYCKKKRITYVDYFSVLADEDGKMAAGLSKDDCHPTMEGYAIMEPIIVKAISKYVR